MASVPRMVAQITVDTTNSVEKQITLTNSILSEYLQGAHNSSQKNEYEQMIVNSVVNY